MRQLSETLSENRRLPPEGDGLSAIASRSQAVRHLPEPGMSLDLIEAAHTAIGAFAQSMNRR